MVVSDDDRNFEQKILAYMSIELLESTIQSLSPTMQKTAEGEKMAAYIRGVKNTTIGATVKNFVLNDPDR